MARDDKFSPLDTLMFVEEVIPIPKCQNCGKLKRLPRGRGYKYDRWICTCDECAAKELKNR